ncbi:MAG: caspase family protein [Elusimicrobiota bacterium]
MNSARFAGIAMTGLLLAGCMPIPKAPSRRDPFAGIDIRTAPPAYPGLTLALILSENTKAAIEYGHQGSAMAGFDVNRFIEEDIEVYKRNFKTVVKVEKMEEARAINADLIALLDTFVEAKRIFKMDSSVVFFSPDQRQIEKIGAQGERSFFTASPATVVSGVAEEVRREIESSLRASAKLAAYAKTRGGSAPRKPTPPEPAARAIRSDVDTPGYKLNERPDDFALVIGVEKYSDLPPAEFAKRDAEAVKEHLLALGFPRRNVIHLSGSQAVRSALAKYLEEWLPRNVKPESRVFFYFSGHGAPDARTGGAYLVPWGGDANFLKSTGYPLKELYRRLDALKAKEVVVALDACFSGAGGRSVLAKGARPLVLKVDTGSPSGGKITLFTAASGTEITSALDDQGHGIFTYFFLKGLNGEARDRSGRVTSKGLYRYLKPKVQDEARRQNREQTPGVFYPSGAGPVLR